MIKELKIGERIFVTQTTYFIYDSEEDRKNDKFYMTTSMEDVFETYKKQARDFEREKRANQKAKQKVNQ